MAQLEGTIKRLVRDRGFGFIREESSGTEYFFHRSGVSGDFESLTEGQKASFEVEKSAKGPRAMQVEPH